MTLVLLFFAVTNTEVQRLITKRPSKKTNYNPALLQLDHAGDDESCRRRAAARAPHEALDPEPPQANGKSPIYA
jgi:hypothetical protein